VRRQRFGSANRIQAQIGGRPTIIDFNSEEVLLQIFWLAADRLLNAKLQKTCPVFGRAKEFALNHPV
jgi:hypothetical protein